MNRKRKVAAITALAMTLMAMAGLAWACSPQSSMVIIPDTGPSARRATASGNLVNPLPVGAGGSESAGTAQIHWNAADGPLLAQVSPSQSGAFSAEVTLPQAAPGVYYLVLTSQSKDVARVAVQVTKPGSTVSAAGVSSGLWSGFSAANSTASLGVASPAAPTGSDPAMLAGMGLTAFGVAASAMGLSVAALRKRRTSRP